MSPGRFAAGLSLGSRVRELWKEGGMGQGNEMTLPVSLGVLWEGFCDYYPILPFCWR